MFTASTVFARAVGFLGNPIVKYAGLALAGWLVLSQVIYVIEDRALAENRVKQLEGDVALLEKTADAVERARQAAEQTTIDLQRDLARVQSILDEVENAPPEDDAPMAPVLRCAVSGVCD